MTRREYLNLRAKIRASYRRRMEALEIVWRQSEQYKAKKLKPAGKEGA